MVYVIIHLFSPVSTKRVENSYFNDIITADIIPGCLPREQDEIFAPSSDSREPLGDLPAAKMGRGVYLQKGVVTDVLATEMFYMCRESRVGGVHRVLNAPGQRQR